MTKEEIIDYLYENNVRGDLAIEQMAEDLANTPQTDLLVKTPQKSRDSHEIDTPQTDCAVTTDTSYQVLDGWQTREKSKTTDCPWK